MKLTELKPKFLRRTDDRSFSDVDTIAEADGILFLCWFAGRYDVLGK